MKITFLANGTRGDIQPLLALGDELQQRGYGVTVTVNQNLANWARGSELEIVESPWDSEAYLRSPAGAAALATADTMAIVADAMRQELDLAPQLTAAYAEACTGANLIISTALTVYRGPSLAEKFGARHAAIATLPWLETAETPNPYVDLPTLGLGLLNKLSYRAFWVMRWRSERAFVHGMRGRLSLPSIKSRPRAEREPTLFAFSELLAPRPCDWPTYAQQSGFLGLTPELRARLGEAAAPLGLDAWLESGSAPIYFGFGSMPVHNPEAMLRMVAEATAALGERALICCGWTSYPESLARQFDHLFIARSLDHDSVLPRCKAAVHHGGAGTTASVCRAGLPSLVAAIWADQPYWAERVVEREVGLAMRYRDLSAKRLKAALGQLLSEHFRSRARALGEALQQEDALGRSADVVEGWLAEPRRLTSVTRVAV